MIYLNRSNKVIHKSKISQGGITGTVTDIRLILKTALDNLATSMILCHNHPSGNLQPSEADISITRRLKESSLLMDITLLDHIIIAGKAYFSFADEGLIVRMIRNFILPGYHHIGPATLSWFARDTGCIQFCCNFNQGNQNKPSLMNERMRNLQAFRSQDQIAHKTKYQYQLLGADSAFLKTSCPSVIQFHSGMFKQFNRFRQSVTISTT